MTIPVSLPQAEEVSADNPLTEEQLAEVAKESSEDWDKTLESDKKEDKESDKEDVTPEDKEDKSDKKSDKLSDKEEEKPEEDEKKEEDGASDEEESDKDAEEDNDEQARIEKIAKDEGITIEEVKENEEKDNSIADRHDKDPIKLARALRKEQSEYGKIKTEVEELREFKKGMVESQTKYNEKALIAKLDEDRDKIIDIYREKNPEDAEYASDDAVFERAKAQILKVVDKKNAEKTVELKETADKQRKEFVKELPEDYKDDLPEIRKLLKECSDNQILDKEFKAEDIAMYVRGKKFTPEYVKSLEKAAYKRGSEKASILPKVPGSKPGSKKGDTTLVASASQTDRDRAVEIYGSREGWTETQMIAEYMKHDKADDF